MIRLSNNLIGVLNVLTFLLSIPILIAGVWLFQQPYTQCDHFLSTPVITVAVFLMVVSVAGMIGSYCRVSWLLWIYLLVMLLLILLLFCFTIFAFIVTNKGSGRVLPNRGYKEYQLGDYSNWLQKRVTSNKNWNRIKNCLQHSSHNCSTFISKYNATELKDLYLKHLSPIEWGCCMPPEVCKLRYEEKTVDWFETPDSDVTNIPDCSKWENEVNRRCYECVTCNAGMIHVIKTDWKKVAIVNIIFLLFLLIVYSVGCRAFRNNRKEGGLKLLKSDPKQNRAQE